LLIDGYLVTCPYCTRPGQIGLPRHFEAIANVADRPIVIYNIPYRTGVNLLNDALLALAAFPSVIGIKDCCADFGQTGGLLALRSPDFSILTRVDALFFTALPQGAGGGTLAIAHYETAAQIFIPVLPTTAIL
jgi:4-hydroxy-tetrahydrodipicolinate synthase